MRIKRLKSKNCEEHLYYFFVEETPLESEKPKYLTKGPIHEWLTFHVSKFGKLHEEWLSPSSMKSKFLNMGFPEYSRTTVCLLGRNEGWGIMPHRQWQMVRNKNLNSTWLQNFNFWLGISSCERQTAADSHPLSEGRLQSSSEKAVLRVISEQTCLSSIAGISSLSTLPPCSMRKHIHWG